MLEQGSDTPIDLGSVTLLTESGDSVTSTISDRDGSFSVTSPVSGSFLLLASALGHRETTVGVFELGEAGELTVEVRIPIEAVTVDGLVVEAERMDLSRPLVLSGFSRRMEAGLGHFLTPTDIEASSAVVPSELFVGIPGLSIRGDQVQVRTPMGFCSPNVYVDGLITPMSENLTLDMIVPMEQLDAVELYRRPTEIPLQYGGSTAGCGVILFWTKTGM